MSIVENHVRSELHKLARQGRLIDEAFKLFQRQVFPGALPDQVSTMRTCFFGGAAELLALMTAGVDDGEEPSEADMALMDAYAEELDRFHARTIAASQAKGGRQ